MEARAADVRAEAQQARIGETDLIRPLWTFLE